MTVPQSLVLCLSLHHQSVNSLIPAVKEPEDEEYSATETYPIIVLKAALDNN